jgi:hypothetical protein
MDKVEKIRRLIGTVRILVDEAEKNFVTHMCRSRLMR